MMPNLKQSHCTGSGVDSTNWCHSLGVISSCRIGTNSMSAGSPMVCRTMLLRIFVFEPTVIRLVPTKVRVDDVTHDADIAPTWFVSGADHQPCIVEPSGRVTGKAAKMGLLHSAERHITYRSLPGFLEGGGRCLPRHDSARLRRPVINRSHEQPLRSTLQLTNTLPSFSPALCGSIGSEPICGDASFSHRSPAKPEWW